jgi:anthranilate phosphoribosyltransferase
MEHSFASYIQILGKGRRGARDLTREEAREAMAMILSGAVEPVQLGAFLMLMRVKEETAPELAGFVEAARAALPSPPQLLTVDLDWASYAGKRRQLPWHILAALLLASHGSRVLMHGVEGGTAGRVYVPQALAALGLVPARSPGDAAQQLERHHFAYLPLEAFNPVLRGMLDLKSVLGLRSPVHTLVRMLNPFAARASLIGIFHPGYDDTHQEAAALLGDVGLAVFKGEGGEPERNPDAACSVKLLREGRMQTQEWPALFGQRHLRDEKLDCNRLRRLWREEEEDEYGTAAVIGTAAIALTAQGRASDPEQAMLQAAHLWHVRNRRFLDSIVY